MKDFFVVMFPSIFIINILFAGFIIFSQRKSPTSTWSWLMVTAFFPPIGFVLYLLFGYEGRKYNIFRAKAVADKALFLGFYDNMSGLKKSNNSKTKEDLNELCAGFGSLARFADISAQAPLTWLEELKIYSHGRDKFNALFNDIESAKSTVFMEYYIIRQDIIGQAVKNLLIKKAREGVKIYLLYDAVGNFFNSRSLISMGGRKNIYTAVFFPPRLIGINYRCHRKICVIDCEKAYIGGFNIGAEYMGLSERFGQWRDCHISLKGGAVAELAMRFIADFGFCSEQGAPPVAINMPKPGSRTVPVQIVSGGPDCRRDNILNVIFKLISTAVKSIYIQTPYFIPDDSILQALKTAALSGMEVKIMIPSKPDHPFVFWASLSYMGELMDAGVRCFGFEGGFLHSKLIICDTAAVSIGTANLDIRSLKLNFETTSLIYDKQTAQKFTDIFNTDLKFCREITLEVYNHRGMSSKIKESLSRLISPML